MKRPPAVVVLDRDGVINHDSPNYIRSARELVPIAGSLEAIADLNRRGIPVALATNQSAVGRGYVDWRTLCEIHERLLQLLAQVGGRLDHIVVCPHAPGEGCPCRKPEPGMLRSIAEHFSVGCRSLVFIGDSATDMGAARRAGARGILVRTGNGERHLADGLIPRGVPAFRDLAQAVTSILDPGPREPMEGSLVLS